MRSSWNLVYRILVGKQTSVLKINFIGSDWDIAPVYTHPRYRLKIPIEFIFVTWSAWNFVHKVLVYVYTHLYTYILDLFKKYHKNHT